MVVGIVTVWPGQCYGHLLYDRGGARQPIGEWNRSAVAMLQCGVILLLLPTPVE
jgi:hypothetical protein